VCFWVVHLLTANYQQTPVFASWFDLVSHRALPKWAKRTLKCVNPFLRQYTRPWARMTEYMSRPRCYHVTRREWNHHHRLTSSVAGGEQHTDAYVLIDPGLHLLDHIKGQFRIVLRFALLGVRICDHLVFPNRKDDLGTLWGPILTCGFWDITFPANIF
jgi:hypothetical protein